MIDTTAVGRVYELSYPLRAETISPPVSDPFELRLTHPHAPFDAGVRLDEQTILSGTDRITLGTHTGTHVDALPHVVRGASSAAYPDGSFPRAIVARGVLLDLPRHFGEACVTRVLSQRDLDDCAARQGTPLREGDAVLIRTGKDDFYDSPAEFLRAPFGGPGEGAAQYLADLGVSVVGSDTMPFEAVPSETPLEVHAILLCDNRIQIIEMLNLSAIAADGVTEFLFVVAPLRIEGGTGSPVNPLAIT